MPYLFSSISNVLLVIYLYQLLILVENIFIIVIVNTSSNYGISTAFFHSLTLLVHIILGLYKKCTFKFNYLFILVYANMYIPIPHQNYHLKTHLG